MKAAVHTWMISHGKRRDEMEQGRLKGKRVLLTGGSGFVGSHLVSHFHQAGANVFIADQNHPRFHRIITDCIPKFSYYQADLRNRHELAGIIEAIWPDIVVHLGAYTALEPSFESAYEGINVDIRGTVNLLEALSVTDYERFILFSSDMVYGNIHVPPLMESLQLKAISPYAASKISAEQFTITCSEINDRPYTILRPFHLYGEGQSMKMFIPEFIRSALKGIPFSMTSGKQSRDFVYIQDACRAVLSACISEEAANETINICSGVEVSIIELAELMSELMNGAEMIPGALEYRNNEIWNMFGSNAKAARILEWQPEVPLLEGLTRTIAWYRNEKGGKGSGTDNEINE